VAPLYLASLHQAAGRFAGARSTLTDLADDSSATAAVRHRARERLWHHAWLRGRLDESRSVLDSLSERTDSFQGRRADLRRLRLATRTCHFYAQQDPGGIPGEPQEIPDVVAEAVAQTQRIRSKLLGGTPSYEMVAESGHARCLLAVGRTKEARRHVDRADSLAGREDIPLLRTYVRLNLLEGRVLEAEGRLQAAIDHYRDHLDMHATRQEALLRVRLPARLYLARAYRKAGHLDRAADAYEAALRKRPAHPYLNRSYARLLADRGETAAATRHARRALTAWSPADPAFRPKRRLKDLQDGLRAGVPSPGPLPLASGLRGGGEPRGDAREDAAYRSDAR
jgi:tetratricopeptide (TPR) repeat protein